MNDNTHFVRLYITKIPDKPLETVYSKERQAHIDSANNENLRRQRYFVWKLLEYALNETLGLKPDDVNFYVNEYGKWTCDKCFFSLSHSKDAVAVAVSTEPIGVDIESSEHCIHPKLHQKILTEKEKAEYSAKPQNDKENFLLQRWCAKESLFKLYDEKQFKPQTIETDCNLICIGTVNLSEQDFYYSVATKNPGHLKINTDILLNK